MAGVKAQHLLLHPITMRLSRRQLDRLHKLREDTGLPDQDHIRRAMDMYLDVVEGKTTKPARR